MSVLNERAAWVAAVVMLGGIAVLPRLAAAHGGPKGLDEYGSFGPPAQCQRVIGRATRVCFEVASREYLNCANARLAGVDCTPDTSDVQQRTVQMIGDHCTTNDVRILGFANVEEAQLDLTNACTQQATAIQSLLYGPAMFSGNVEPGPEARDRCMRTVSRYAFKIARTALRERNRALDRIAASSQSLEMPQKQEMLDAADAKVASVQAMALQQIRNRCSDAEFNASYGMSFDDFAARLVGRSDCVVFAGHVVDAYTCPTPVCGNAVKEPSEECDDGNEDDTDACDHACKRTSCESFSSTFAAIQDTIFEQKGCNTDICHGASRAGGLDLRPDAAYKSLLEPEHATISSLKRVEGGSPEFSFLYKKLAAATLGTPVEGSPMPNGGLPPLTADELKAIRLWIYNFAPEAGVVESTAGLLNACLPPADPIQIDPPAPPAAGQGVQLRMPRIEIPPGSENEVCLATYYDLSGQVPEGVEKDYANNATFRYKKKVEAQDPVSHHLIIHSYLGKYGPEDPGWGAWTCKGGIKNGETCNPKDLTFCGNDSVCGSEPKRSVACIGFGPPDYNEGVAPAFGGSQQPLAVSQWATGVYSEIPVKGMIVWNSHHFNLTDHPAKVEAWVNFDFAFQQDQVSPVQGGILDPDGRIFVMNVPPFQRNRYCHHFTFPQGARLFEISSHMHKRGKLFQIYDPAGELIYTSTQYNDPVQLDFPTPLALDSANAADRTYSYCAEYDNGYTNPNDVKKRSNSPIPPPPFPPIPCTATTCTAGKMGSLCSGVGDAARKASCDSTPGAGDGVCDACTLRGGVTTEDEMFLFLAYYYCSTDFPETCKNEYGFLGVGNNPGS